MNIRHPLSLGVCAVGAATCLFMLWRGSGPPSVTPPNPPSQAEQSCRAENHALPDFALCLLEREPDRWVDQGYGNGIRHPTGIEITYMGALQYHDEYLGSDDRIRHAYFDWRDRQHAHLQDRAAAALQLGHNGE